MLDNKQTEHASRLLSVSSGCHKPLQMLLHVTANTDMVYTFAVVATRYELGMRAEFLWQGTADFTAWLAASACLELQRALQPQRITTYNHDLARRATAMLLSAWGTSTALGIATDGSTAGLVAIELPWPLQIPPRSSSSNSTAEASTAVRVAVNRVQPSSSTVSVPDDAKGSDGKGSSERGPTPADAAALNLLLREQYSIEVPVACVSGLLFTRISAQIYNTMADYGRLRDVICGLRSSATLRHMPS
jgi:selenocysteine lyase/cysteine desulfurase